jgi:hypothetical protein
MNTWSLAENNAIANSLLEARHARSWKEWLRYMNNALAFYLV